jgi:hypothetical protein
MAAPGAPVRVAGSLVALLLAAGALVAGPALARPYADPFAYCAAVGTVDAPDQRYTGPTVPESIALGLRRAFGAAPDAPIETFVRGTSWRCMDGKVYACNVGANLPCQGKADTNRVAAAPVAEFCRENPQADVVPAYVTGRDTVYEWRCENGAPEAGRQFDAPDPRGFLTNIWHQIPPPAR